MVYEFRIGTSAGSMSLLSALDIVAPHWEFSPFSVSKETGDGSVKGGGWTVTNWHWGFLTYAQYQTLRAYCPGKSASVYIRTPKTTVDWESYSAKVEWPDFEVWSNSRVLDFELKFTDMTEL